MWPFRRRCRMQPVASWLTTNADVNYGKAMRLRDEIAACVRDLKATPWGGLPSCKGVSIGAIFGAVRALEEVVREL